MKTILKLLILVCLIIPSIALAHPGGLDGHKCHYCRTNCEAKYGIPTGDYHCHASGDKSVYTPIPVVEEGPAPTSPVTKPEPVPVPSTPAPDPTPLPPPKSNTITPEPSPQTPIVIPSEPAPSVQAPAATITPKSNIQGTEEVLVEEETPDEEEKVEKTPTEKVVEETQQEEPTNNEPPEKEEPKGNALLGFLILGGLGYGTYRGGKAGIEKAKKMLS